MPARFINWKASAGKNQLLAKVLEPSAELRICIAVDVCPFFYPEPKPEAFEQALSVAASLVVWAVNNRVQFGLLANGRQKGLSHPVIIPVGSAPNQAASALEALARVELEPFNTLAGLLGKGGLRLPPGTMLLVIGKGNNAHQPPMFSSIPRIRQIYINYYMNFLH